MSWRRGLNLPERLRGVAPPLLVELGVALAATAAAVGLRLAIDLFFGDIVEFALVFPALAAATLVAGVRAGAMTLVMAQVLAWYFILPVKRSFVFATAGDAVSLVLSTVAEVLLLVFVAGYRGVAARALALEESRSEALRRSLEAHAAQEAIDAELRRKDASLRQTRLNLTAIYEASADGLSLCEAVPGPHTRVAGYKILESNAAYEDLTRTGRDRTTEGADGEQDPDADPRWLESAAEALATGRMQQFDVRSPATDRWLNVRVSRVSGALFQQTVVDVTDRRRLDEQRTRLLQETRHRVANNFQMMASFLHAQASIAHPLAQQQLLTAEGRVQVLGRLHELLAYAESDSLIEAADYIEELCAQLRLIIDRPDVRLTTALAHARLGADRIVPVGFIINELVTNAVKYAFPVTGGTIEVRLLRDGPALQLEVQDDGVGLTGHEEAGPVRGGLGSRLVRTFTAQIKGEMTTISGPGLLTRIRFPVPAPEDG